MTDLSIGLELIYSLNDQKDVHMTISFEPRVRRSCVRLTFRLTLLSNCEALVLHFYCCKVSERFH